MNPPSAAEAEAAERELAQLIRDAQQLGLRLERSQAARLLRLLDVLARWNRAYNLTSITQRPAMIAAHLLDSLSAAGELSGSLIADVGTGAGFPGLPLALVCPERSFTLIDSVAKKIRFVTHAARELQLSNVLALHARVETLTPDQPFDTVIARAVAALPELLASVQGITAPGTCVVALKGRYPHAELAQLPPQWQLERVRPVLIPGLSAERHIVRLWRRHELGNLGTESVARSL